MKIDIDKLVKLSYPQDNIELEKPDLISLLKNGKHE